MASKNKYVIRHSLFGKRSRAYFATKKAAIEFAAVWGLPKSQIKAL